MREESLTFRRFILTLFLAFSIAVLIQVLRVADLGDVEGRDPEGSASPCRDLGSLLEESLARQEGLVSVSEAEVNSYLRKTVTGRQKGITGLFVSFEGAYVNFMENELEVLLVRKVLGRPFVVGCRCGLASGGKGIVVRSTGSSVGKLKIRRAVVKVAMGSFRRLAGVYQPELALLARMGGVSLEEGRIVLDPVGDPPVAIRR